MSSVLKGIFFFYFFFGGSVRGGSVEVVAKLPKGLCRRITDPTGGADRWQVETRDGPDKGTQSRGTALS